MCEVSQLELAEGELWASPSLLKLSHAPADTLADPMLLWLREQHPAFRSTMEKIEQRRGKLIVHENLLVARVKDLALKVMLERQFGGPGKLVGLSDEFVAFPSALLAELQSWMKKTGHVIKRLDADLPPSDERLSVQARRHYLLAAPSHVATVSAEGYGSETEFVLEAGLVEAVLNGRLKPTRASVPFRSLMAQLAKFPLFDQKPTRQLLDDYAVKHYLREENDLIRASWRGPAWDSQAWPQSFLDQPNLNAW